MTPVTIGLAGLGILFYFNLEADKLHNLAEEANLKVREVDTELRNSEVFLKSLVVATINLQNNGVRSPSAYDEIVLSSMSIRPKLITGFGVMQTPNGLVDRQWFGPYIEESLPNRGVKLPEYANYSLVELWQVDRYPELQYYTDAIKANKYFWSKPYINQIYPIPLVTFAGPIRDRNGNLIGIVNGDINIRDLNLNDQSKSKEGGYSVFVTQEGIFLGYAPEPNKVSNLENIASIPSLKVVWDEIQHALAQGKSQGYFKSNATQSYWVYQRVPSSQWVMLQSIPYDTVVKPALLLSFSATLSSAIVLAFVVVLFIRYLNRRLQPILEACNETCIESGVHNKSKDEISRLSTAFFHMMERQENLLQQLQQTNIQLIESHRLKDSFLANMSHELRTPLNAILGMTEGLQDRVFGTVNDRQLNALQIVESSGNHLLELINDILDLAKIESGQIELDCAPASLPLIVQSSLEFVKQQALKKQIQIAIKLAPNLPNLQIDERRIRQALINLLSNAVKFTPTGGSVILEVTQLPSSLNKTIETTQDYLQIAVSDTGIGIAPENIQKLFQPFIQIDSALNRQFEGTGLGLALVKRIVELHGGSVGLTSELGVGSCFTILLPCLPPSNPQTEMGTNNLSVEHSELELSNTDKDVRQDFLILVVDDDEVNSMTVSSYLKAKGYRILLAKDGQEAIALSKAHHPDLILMDIQMPVMNGIEATRQIRLDPNLVDIPIIALTALAMTGDREKCLEAGANEYLSKPIKLKQLATIIQQIFVQNSQLQSNAM
ncbi:response regulator [Pseudanabaena sp. lw0831]|uniref:response regulator n=1 Tax=Pseudanabaena sp. lw0831 TaxID=1357935 RepID=UPI00191514D5|nr:response regulator [Pseudanabaena sp. lw0831]